MVLKYKTKSEAIIEIEERLKTNTLAFSTLVLASGSQPILLDGSNEIKGIKAINQFIDLFEQEKQQWYYCDC